MMRRRRDDAAIVVARPLRVIRATARASRGALLAASVVLAALGLKSLMAPQPVARLATSREPGYDLAAEAFAEDFTRAYLEWDSRAPDAHEHAVERFLGRDVDAAAG